MRASLSTFSTQKAGGTSDDYEDAFASRPKAAQDEDVLADELLVAVADGASESLLASRWAGLLVEEFVDADGPHDGRSFASAAVRTASKWPHVRGGYVREREARGRPIKWYEEPGLERGAYATLLVAQFAGGATGTWSAAALGDSCLFHVSGDDLLAAFPMTDSAAFGIQPDLLGSRDPDDELIASRVSLTTGKWNEADQFYLCTDALAAWFLAESEVGARPWEILSDLGTDAEVGVFNDWISTLRLEGRMRNDDVTLVRIHMW